MVGLVSLFVGFVFQAIGYFLTLEGHGVTAKRPWGAIVAAGFALLAAIAVGAIHVLWRKRLMKGFLFEIAHYDTQGIRQSLPSVNELNTYAEFLGLGRPIVPGESTREYVGRAWGVSETRD